MEKDLNLNILNKKSNNQIKSSEIKKQEASDFQIHLRQEVFDHLVYPLSSKLDDNIILQLFRKLHLMSTIDYKISIENWIDQACTFLQGLPEKEARILFNTYKVISSEFELTSQSGKKVDSKNQVDVRYFALFIALQCFSQKSKVISTIDTLDKNAYSSTGYNSNPNTNPYSSPLSSPRGKQNSLRNSNTAQMNEILNMSNFVKNNIKLFLRLVASDIHNSETQINSSEFNTLKFFFRENFQLNQSLNSSSSSVKKISGLSSLAPFFQNFSPTTKVNIEKVTEWIIGMISTSPLDNDDHTVVLRNLSKCTTIKKDFSGKCIKIINCEDSQIFIDSCVLNLKISLCNNCTIFCAGVVKFSTIEKCESCNITVCSNFLKVGNTIECRVNSMVFNEPIVYGNNIGLILGPHNVFYDDLNSTLKAGRFIFGDLNMFSQPIVIVQALNTSTSGNLKSPYDILNIKDFSPMSTPFSFTKEIEDSFFLTPKEYLNEYLTKIEVFKSVQLMIKNANLDASQEKALHVAIQGFFKKWLENTNSIKNVQEILKLLDYSSLNN